MKPYQIGSVYVDLDHVLAVDAEAQTGLYSCVTGYVRLAFTPEPVQIQVGRFETEYSVGGRVLSRDETEIERLKAEWREFVTAWKTKDTMFGGSK